MARTCPRCRGTGQVDDMSRGDFLKEARQAAKMSVRQAAEYAGLSPTTIQNSEKRGRSIDFGTIKKLAALYQVSLDEVPAD